MFTGLAAAPSPTEPCHQPPMKLLQRVKSLLAALITYRVNARGRRDRKAGFVLCRVFWCAWTFVVTTTHPRVLPAEHPPHSGASASMPIAG